MGKIAELCYYERLRKYEEEKKRIKKEHPDYTPKEYERAIKKLADKWEV